MNTRVTVERLREFNQMDLEDICDATADTMNETSGFNIGTQRTNSTQRIQISAYWQGVLLVPERVLFVGKLDGVVAGAVQLVKPSPSNQISAFSCSVDNHFVAPWARGYGLSNMLLSHVENEAKMLGYSIIKLSVRETRTAAITVFEKRGYIKWGILPKYELDGGKIVAGFFYFKEL